MAYPNNVSIADAIKSYYALPRNHRVRFNHYRRDLLTPTRARTSTGRNSEVGGSSLHRSMANLLGGVCRQEDHRREAALGPHGPQKLETNPACPMGSPANRRPLSTRPSAGGRP